MGVSDPIANMLTKIRNASLARHEEVKIASSKMNLEIVKIFKNEGYVKMFKTDKIESLSVIRIVLKYDDVRKSVIHGIRKISTPGRRIYAGYRDMPRVLNGYGTLIVSTSFGVITGKKARDRGIGGEIICEIW